MNDIFEESITAIPVVREKAWLRGSVAAGPRLRFPELFPDIPEESPLRKLKELKRNWDGEGAEPFSLILLHRAMKLWEDLTKSLSKEQLPQVVPGREDFISFVWSVDQPSKRLEVWIHGDLNHYQADWCLERGDSQECGTAGKRPDLMRVIGEYVKA
ncbi:MAG: hypothetical protein K2Z81_01825 [Cyanobacteria bacterium]|nr:hypothetical protein [Cyanobacteriota bacterium]